ncbi:unnamed protein product [Peronospora destructor]|uniref:Enoyl reductase (ER) domain-containing protein n=1 Tax=Peronospora destructor TaxID=86335 RepID=A0AAV0U5Z0_9STRA|nr:unnamed protein product [Peronospora destructor]
MRSWSYTKYGGPYVKVHAAALNPIDYKRRQGVLKMILQQQTWPHVVGYDFSGMVTHCGDDVDKVALGDEVFGMLPHNDNGALADFLVVRAEYISKKPTNLTHVEAAALPLAGQTALQSFRLGQLAENKKVLITGGAGGVGSIAIQIAKSVFKAQTLATTSSTKKMEKMRLLGADYVIDYGHKRFEQEVANFDFALDCTGETKQCFQCIIRDGTVVSISETPTWKSLSTCGNHQSITYEYLFVVPDGAAIDEICQLAKQRVITPIIDKVFPFEKADMAMEYLEAGHATGKVVVQLVD